MLLCIRNDGRNGHFHDSYVNNISTLGTGFLTLTSILNQLLNSQNLSSESFLIIIPSLIFLLLSDTFSKMVAVSSMPFYSIYCFKICNLLYNTYINSSVMLLLLCSQRILLDNSFNGVLFFDDFPPHPPYSMGNLKHELDFVLPFVFLFPLLNYKLTEY